MKFDEKRLFAWVAKAVLSDELEPYRAVLANLQAQMICIRARERKQQTERIERDRMLAQKQSAREQQQAAKQIERDRAAAEKHAASVEANRQAMLRGTQRFNLQQAKEQRRERMQALRTEIKAQIKHRAALFEPSSLDAFDKDKIAVADARLRELNAQYQALHNELH